MNGTREQAALLVRAVAAGLAAGAAALLLRTVITLLPRLVWPAAPDLVQAVALASPAWKILIPVAGALVAGGLLAAGARWAGATRGWDVLEAVALRHGQLPFRPSLVQAASAVVTQAVEEEIGQREYWTYLALLGLLVLLIEWYAYHRRLRAPTVFKPLRSART